MITIRALGQTIEQDGEVVLISKDMPADCMVLFVDLPTWQEIKDDVQLAPNQEGMR